MFSSDPNAHAPGDARLARRRPARHSRGMKNLVRWGTFALVTAAAAVTLACLLLLLSRLYGRLASTEAVLLALVLFSIAVTLIAINFAAKFEEIDEAQARRRPGRRRGR
jgi:hypothetical protein